MHDTRAAELTVLSAAVKTDPASPEIRALLANFGMLEDHRDTFLAVLRAGYWRKAKSPFNFVKSKVFAACFEDPRDALGDADIHEGAMEHECALFGPGRAALSSALTAEDDLSFSDPVGDLERYTPRGHDRVHRSLLKRVPVDPTGEWSLDFEWQLDLNKVAEGMRLDPLEIVVLEYKGDGLSFRFAARLDQNRMRQKELKAAWARVDRLLASGKLASFLENPEISTGRGVVTSPVRQRL